MLRCLYCNRREAINGYVICEECLKRKEEEMGEDFDESIWKWKTHPKDYTEFDLIDDLQEADRKLEALKDVEELAKKLKEGWKS